MADIFSEVDDAVKQEKLEAFWQKYGNTIITAIAIFFIIPAGTSAWLRWKKNHYKEQKSVLLSASDAVPGKVSEDENEDESVAGLTGLHRLMYFVNRGNSALESNQSLNALDYFRQARDVENAPRFFTEYASLKYAQTAFSLLSSEQNHGLESSDKIMQILAPLRDDGDSSWSGQALFLSAQIAAYGLNDASQALDLLDKISQAELQEAGLTQPAEAMRRTIMYDFSMKPSGPGQNDEKEVTSN